MPPATTTSARSSSATTRASCGSCSSRCPASSPASAAGCSPSPMRSSLSMRVAAPLSANALLMAYIGGTTVFVGPVLGAILITLLQSGVSLMSNSWLVYVGVLFIAMVIFAPTGLAGIDPGARARSRAPACCARLVVPYLRAGPRPGRAAGLRRAGGAAVVPDDRRRAGQELVLFGQPIDVYSRAAVGDLAGAACWSAASGCASRPRLPPRLGGLTADRGRRAMTAVAARCAT